MSAEGTMRMLSVLSVVIGFACVVNSILLMSMSKTMELRILALMPMIVGIPFSYLLYRQAGWAVFGAEKLA